MIKLYDSPGSPFCRRVRICLAEKGLSYEKILVDLGKEENRQPEYLRLNPYGKVPVLVDGEAVIYESAIINEYLEDHYPEPPLMPTDPLLRARARIFIDYCDHQFGVPLRTLRLELQKPETERDRAKMDEAEAEVHKNLEWLDHQIGDKEFLVGAFSLADVGMMPRVGTLQQIRFSPHASLTSALGWMERLKSRKSFGA
jgi:glutathione S-transferase